MEILDLFLCLFLVRLAIQLPLAKDPISRFPAHIVVPALVFAFPTSATPVHSGHAIVRRGIVSPTPEELLHNTIAFCIPAGLCFILRMVNRIWVLKSIQLEDYIMCITMFFYISMLTLINVSAAYATNLFPTEQLESILANPQDVHDRIMGSKLVIPLEQSMLTSTWLVKICIWCFLHRCCRQLENYLLWLKWLLVYIVVSYFIIQIYYYAGMCRPFSQYWAVPVENIQCATYAHYSIMQMVFNLSSDFALIVIPCTMVARVNLPLKRKAVLFLVFTLAGFTIVAAILNKTYNFLSPLTTVYQVWYIREASVATTVGNLICTWQLLQKLFKLRSFDDKKAEIEASPEMGDNVTGQQVSRRTIGGTPRVGGRPSTKKSKWGAMSPALRLTHSDLSTFSTFGRSRVEKTVNNESEMTSDTAVGTPGVEEKRGIFARADSQADEKPMTLVRDDDDATDAVRYRARLDID